MNGSANLIEFFSAANRPGAPLTLYYCGWQKCTPGHAFGPAIRPHYLFHYILAGKGIYRRGASFYALQKNTGFLIHPGESTFYRADETTPWEYCWIGFDGHDADNILTNCGLGDTVVFADQSGGQLEQSLRELIFHYEKNSANEYALLSCLYRCFSHMKASRPEPQNSADYVNAAIDYMRHNYSYKIKISDIARHIGIDRTYLYRLFLRDCRLSPQHYLLRCRLHAAVDLLETGSLNITEIANSCGFSNTAAFCRQFKNAYACTPLDYRKNKRYFHLTK